MSRARSYTSTQLNPILFTHLLVVRQGPRLFLKEKIPTDVMVCSQYRNKSHPTLMLCYSIDLSFFFNITKKKKRFLFLEIDFFLASSVDEIPRFVAFHLRPHCLQ